MTRNEIIDKIMKFKSYKMKERNGVLSFVNKDNPYRLIFLSSNTIFLVDNYSEDGKTFTISTVKNIEEEKNKVIVTLYDGESEEF